ncbi:SpoIIE family protein phosphatase [Nocardioides malaquae]|uniref:SpoIIE family protein phosphatase n=1 Tax=Nocardioides malaquae TaxID=2773426 RepID=UPI001D0CFCA1|nr:SpoIIE family protein phosphatase [Nocardioides malaquae]
MTINDQPVRPTARLTLSSTHGDDPEFLRSAHARLVTDQLVDTTRLDRLTELTARLLGTSSSQVSIISDVQTVVGGTGMAAEAVLKQSPAEDSLCTVTVNQGTSLVVTDAALDSRVAGLPPVTSGAVGTYAGVPLRAGGHLVGALCAYDRDVRTWTEQDVTLLELIGEAVTAELELAAVEASYGADRQVWGLAVEAAGVGAYDWDLRTGELRWDDRTLELFGLDRVRFDGRIETFNALVHPEDRDRVIRALGEIVEQCGVLDLEYRVVLPEGRTRWVLARGAVYPGEAGQPERLVGAVLDTTRVQEGEARMTRVLEAMPSAFFSVDREWRFTYANAHAQQLLAGVSRDLGGHVIWELFPQAVGSEFEVRYRQAVESDEPVAFEAYYPPPLDAWYEVRAWPSPEGLSVYFLDITERRAAQDELARSAERGSLLAEVTSSLTATFDTYQAVGRLSQLLVPRLGEWCIVTLVDHVEPFSQPDWRRHVRDIGLWHVDESQRSTLERYAELRIPMLNDDSYLARAITGESSVLVADRAYEQVTATLGSGEARERYLELEPRTVAFLPVRGRGRTVGALTVGRGHDLPPFTPEELNTLVDIAARAGLALDNARSYAEQRELAEGLQRSLLTPPPDPGHLEVAVRYEPAAEVAQVGGDWYDSFLQTDGSVVVVIGDVVGHDTVAAAAMGQLRALLRGIAVTTGGGPAEVLGRVDSAMPTLQIDTTATAVMAQVEQTPDEREAGTARLRWSNAGHPPPLIAVPQADGSVLTEVLEGVEPDLLLGMDLGVERREAVAVVPVGSTVLLYSDGLVERRGQHLEDGIEQLRGTLADLVASGADLDTLSDELLARMLPERPEGDVALVALRLRRPVEA